MLVLMSLQECCEPQIPEWSQCWDLWRTVQQPAQTREGLSTSHSLQMNCSRSIFSCWTVYICVLLICIWVKRDWQKCRTTHGLLLIKELNMRQTAHQKCKLTWRKIQHFPGYDMSLLLLLFTVPVSCLTLFSTECARLCLLYQFKYFHETCSQMSAFLSTFRFKETFRSYLKRPKKKNGDCWLCWQTHSLWSEGLIYHWRSVLIGGLLPKQKPAFNHVNFILNCAIMASPPNPLRTLCGPSVLLEGELK